MIDFDDEGLKDINEAKASIRLIQEKLYEDEIDAKEIFKITNKLNEFIDNIAINYDLKK